MVYGRLVRGLTRGCRELRKFPDILEDTIEEACKWIREVTRASADAEGDYDKVVKDVEEAGTAVDLASEVTGTLPVANGGSGRASHTAYAVICGGTTSTAAQQSVASVGTSGHLLTSNGAGALPTFQAPAAPPVGVTIQTVYATPYVDNTSITETIPDDDTTPQQSTEGTKILEVTITPQYSTSVIELEFNGFGSASAAVIMTAALFKDSTEDAIAVSTAVAGAVTLPQAMKLIHHEVSGNTTARTYKLHVATNTGGTMRMNGSTTARFYGGKAACVLIAREIRA